MRGSEGTCDRKCTLTNEGILVAIRIDVKKTFDLLRFADDSPNQRVRPLVPLKRG